MRYSKFYLAILALTMINVFNYRCMASGSSHPKPVDIYAANKYLAKTLNIAFTFDAPKEGAWGHVLKAEDFQIIKKAGFTAVRLPVQWVARMQTDAPYHIDSLFLERIDWAIKMALQNNLAIILDNHLDAQLMAEPEKYHDRFLSLWKQLSAHYHNASQMVMFEVLAEPSGKLSPLWNTYFNEALTVIRQTNPVRPVIVGPTFYNLATKINELQLPEDDRYLIVTFHYYEPIHFTMQGEEWFTYGKPREWIGTQWMGTETEKDNIKKTMNLMADWAKQHNRPVMLGEFGAGNHADVQSKARYFRFIREEAERNNFSWGFFNYAVQFSLYDQTTKKWQPDLLNALIGN
jgi:endoglucanase